MGPLNSWELVCTVGALFFAIYTYRRRHITPCPLPPGPRGLPVVGNLFDIPSLYPWKVYAEWGRKFDSDILYLNAAGQSIVVVNSYEAIRELFDERSTIYSSRPHSVMLLELSGFDFQFGLMPYGEPWRIRRKLFKKYLDSSNALIYQIREVKYVHRLLSQLLEHPENYKELILYMAGSMSISMTYGVDILPQDDPNLRVAELASRAVTESLITGSRSVDIIPILKYLPGWFPGASFQEVAVRSRGYVKRLREGVFKEAREKWLTNQSPNPCFISLCLENCEERNKDEQLIAFKDVAANVHMAASLPTSAVIETFILAMVCFPDVQKRAQQELDHVLEGERLPDHADEELLPYFAAVLKEVLRWRIVVPNGVPHASTAGDVYKGYYIPENSIVIPNAWAMLNDEADFPEPTEFRPERFLTSEGQLRTDGSVRDPADILFGFGRRICPGLHIAKSNIWLTVACLLTVFDFEKALDANGQPIEPVCEYGSAGLSLPPPFKCTIKPRSKNAALLIQEANEQSSGNNE